MKAEHRRLLGSVTLCALLGATFAGAALLPADRARGVDRNFALSGQIDYLLVPSDPQARTFSLSGFTAELALKLAADFNDHLSANVKLCYGCHGFETGMAYFDLRVADELNFRVGRFIPSFGEFPLRHDPANHRTADKPLPYDMGRMLRLREWNMSILPAPYVDNGVEINGTHWFGDTIQFDYALYLVSGFKGASDGLDLDFVQSRSGNLYYVDNNSVPAFGGRLALTVNFGDDVTASLGVSGHYGTYDPDAELDYTVLGADFFLRIGALNLRGEYLLRRTRFGVGDDPQSRFRYDGYDSSGHFVDFFTKDGFYIEADHPLGRRIELVARFDGMRRIGNVPVASALRRESAVLRYTLGTNFIIARGVRVKLSGELWDFSDFDDELAFHLGLVAAF